MADQVEFNEAKLMLGCDDATLNNYINNGTIRAQTVDGAKMLDRADVLHLVNASGTDSDDGTIILSGDSEDLSIDLGEVVDDNAATMIQPLGGDSEGTESITFGDDLEVVSFDDGNTEELSFDDTDATQNLSFTEEQTVVMTDVDETAMQTATATSDFQTVDYDDDEGEDDAAYAAAASSRRSVRSQRVRTPPPKTHWFWPVCLTLQLIVAALIIAPFYPMSLMPRGEGEEERDYAGNIIRGVDDNGWTNMAAGVVGFSIEPDPKKFAAVHQGKPHIPLSSVDPNQPRGFRFQEYDGDFTPEEREASVFVSNVIFDQAAENEADPTEDLIPISAEVMYNGAVIQTYQIEAVTTQVDAGAGNTQTVQKHRPRLRYRRSN